MRAEADGPFALAAATGRMPVPARRTDSLTEAMPSCGVPEAPPTDSPAGDFPPADDFPADDFPAGLMSSLRAACVVVNE